MDMEKRIADTTKELAGVRARLEALGPIVVGTISSSRKKYRTKDGKERHCADSAMLKLAGGGAGSTLRIPADKEKLVRKLIGNGRKWRELNKRWTLLTSRLAVYGALKKTTRDADSQVRQPHGNPRTGR